jgi:hypothetical protein
MRLQVIAASLPWDGNAAVSEEARCGSTGLLLGDPFNLGIDACAHLRPVLHIRYVVIINDESVSVLCQFRNSGLVACPGFLAAKISQDVRDC